MYLSRVDIPNFTQSWVVTFRSARAEVSNQGVGTHRYRVGFGHAPRTVHSDTRTRGGCCAVPLRPSRAKRENPETRPLLGSSTFSTRLARFRRGFVCSNPRCEDRNHIQCERFSYSLNEAGIQTPCKLHCSLAMPLICINSNKQLCPS